MATRHWKRFTRVFALIAAVISCGPAQYRDPNVKMQYATRIWVDPKSSLSADDVLAGCQKWHDKGIVCELVAEKKKADIRVTENVEPCVADKDGYRTLAWMSIDSGLMIFRSTCFQDSGGPFKATMFRGVSGHEFGHAFGISWHVPKKGSDGTCEFSKDGAKNGFEKARKQANGEALCGNALMNRYYTGNDFITEVDSKAFDLRDITPSPRFQDMSGPETVGEQVVPGADIEIVDCVVRAR